jgi:hypothetical protein
MVILGTGAAMRSGEGFDRLALPISERRTRLGDCRSAPLVCGLG